MPENFVPYRIGLQQRMLPIYRGAFFNLLAERCKGGFSVFAGDARPSESVTPLNCLPSANLTHAENLHLFQGKLYLCWQMNLMTWLNKWNPDVLIMEANPRYLHSPAAIRWMHRRQRPVIGWGLGTGGLVQPGSLAGSLWRNFLRSFDGVISYSQTGADEYIRAGVAAYSVFVAPNAVLSAPMKEILRPNRFADEGPVVLYVGRLQARKNVDVLIHACGNIKRTQPVQLWVIGDGPERNALEELAKTVFPSTKFYGALHGDDSQAYFQQADLFVLPGTGGLAVQEAMFYSLPVIVGEADGTQSNLVTEENGWLLTDCSVEKLTQVIHEALLNIGQLREKGKRSFDIAKNEVNLERMADVFIEAIDFVMEKRAV